MTENIRRKYPGLKVYDTQYLDLSSFCYLFVSNLNSCAPHDEECANLSA
jgi:hypothetical protein